MNLFKLVLKSHKLKYDIKNYINDKLDGDKSINKRIYNNIILTFLNEKDNVYILDMRNSDIWNDDLESIIQDLRNDWTPVNPVHLNFLFNEVHKYLNFKFKLYKNITIERYKYGELESLRIYYKK